jgi:hypothetical protein
VLHGSLGRRSVSAAHSGWPSLDVIAGLPRSCSSAKKQSRYRRVARPLLVVRHGGLSPVNSLAWWLRQEHPGSSWITERELRRDVFRRRRGEDRRLRHAQEPRTPNGMLVLASTASATVSSPRFASSRLLRLDHTPSQG